ncbi:hypothetical protein [Tessaracoccus flavus]|uniref:Uncharacterized protein n=1 Tax=Tessaracoccus flavus TaxID=1610493 RepID=A0A1Q2CHB0_9ACTN|nr:hypothetical protein [Tessaracoccus flavus]AQP45445.1 hypothetical protein RPIT_12060 [Tessaracoccus flavus]SDY92034.1 hypothetical protein SAMN05428934_10663 [Tessaracoccus flavus]
MRSVQLRAQLTYASYESEGSGGWQTKDIVGQLLPEEQSVLLANIPTRLPSPEAGRFVTREEAALWPRRLAHQVLKASEFAFPVLIHSVSAGQDRSGRPGNVFTHCAIPARPLERPAFAWRSNSWLTPFGADAVDASSLTEGGTLNMDMSPSTVGVFLGQGKVWRPGVLAVLLDALHARLRGTGPLVVLIAGETDEAAGWLQAASLCMSGRTSRSFYFSTLETAPVGDELDAQGFHLVCLLPELRKTVEQWGNAVVIDAEESPSLGVLGEAPHLTTRGDEVEVTPWSTLMFEEVAMAPDLEAYVADLNALELQIPGRDSNDPAWWLALRAFLRPGAELDAALVRVVAQAAPPGVADTPELADAVQRALLRSMGATTQERWSALQSLEKERCSTHILRLATAAYLDSVFADPAWLADAPDVVPSYKPGLPSGGTALRARDLTAKLSRLDSESATRAALRFVDLVDHLGWQTVPDIAASVEEAADKALVPALLKTEGFVKSWDAHAPRRPLTIALTQEVALILAPTTRLPGRILDRLKIATFDFLTSNRALEPDNRRFNALGLQALDGLAGNKAALSEADRLRLDFMEVWRACQERSQGWRSSRSDPVTLTPQQSGELLAAWGRFVPRQVLDRSILSADVQDPKLRLLLQQVLQSSSQGHRNRVAAAYETLVSGDWNQPYQLASVRSVFDTLTTSAASVGVVLNEQIQGILLVMATTALVSRADKDFAVQVRNRLTQPKPSESIIQDGAQFFARSLPGGDTSTFVRSVLPYVVDQSLIGQDPVRSLLLDFKPSDGDSVVERLIRVASLDQEVTEGAIVEALEWYTAKMGEKAAQAIHRNALRWFRQRGVIKSAGLGAKLMKGLGGSK